MQSIKTSSVGSKLKAGCNQLFDRLLRNNESNSDALYGKSLILYSEGKIEESAELLAKVLRYNPRGEDYQINKLKKNLLDLLEPNKIDILDELKKEEVKDEQPTADSSRATADQKKLKQPSSFYCSLCSKSFSKAFSLRRHMLIHEGIKNFNCEKCGRSFIQKSDLKRHLLTHIDLFEVTCSFEGCTRRFRSKKSMRSHLQVHAENRFVTCDICNRVYLSKRSLKIHKDMHFGILPFSCDTCGKSFPLKSSVRSHIKTHSKEKPFLCTICPSRFKRTFDLQVHKKMIHSYLSP